MTQISFSELNELVGSLGVGSVAMLGFAMVLDSMAPLSELIEENAGSQTWTFFVVVPLIVFSYVAGVLCVAIGRTTRQTVMRNRPTPFDLASIDEKLVGLVTLEYRNFTRRLDILDGTIAAFVILALGVACESNAEGLILFGVVSCTTALVASALAMRIAERSECEFRFFLKTAVRK